MRPATPLAGTERSATRALVLQYGGVQNARASDGTERGGRESHEILECPAFWAEAGASVKRIQRSRGVRNKTVSGVNCYGERCKALVLLIFFSACARACAFLKSDPQRLKPFWFYGVCGAAEAAPFQNEFASGFFAL